MNNGLSSALISWVKLDILLPKNLGMNEKNSGAAWRNTVDVIPLAFGIKDHFKYFTTVSAELHAAVEYTARGRGLQGLARL